MRVAPGNSEKDRLADLGGKGLRSLQISSNNNSKVAYETLESQSRAHSWESGHRQEPS